MALTNEDLQAIAGLLQPIKDDVQKQNTRQYIKKKIHKSENLVPEEVSRVHLILERHMKDNAKHSAIPSPPEYQLMLKILFQRFNLAGYNTCPCPRILLY